VRQAPPLENGAEEGEKSRLKDGDHQDGLAGRHPLIVTKATRRGRIHARAATAIFDRRAAGTSQEKLTETKRPWLAAQG
jgi:hypothetical protein